MAGTFRNSGIRKYGTRLDADARADVKIRLLCPRSDSLTQLWRRECAFGNSAACESAAGRTGYPNVGLAQRHDRDVGTQRAENVVRCGRHRHHRRDRASQTRARPVRNWSRFQLRMPVALVGGCTARGCIRYSRFGGTLLRVAHIGQPCCVRPPTVVVAWRMSQAAVFTAIPNDSARHGAGGAARLAERPPA